MKLTKRQREVLEAYARTPPGIVPSAIQQYIGTGSTHRRAVRENALRGILLNLAHKGLVKYGDTVEVTVKGREVLGGREFLLRETLHDLYVAVSRHGYSTTTSDGRMLFEVMQKADAVLTETAPRSV